VNQMVDAPNYRWKIQMLVQRLCYRGGLKTGHEQGGANPFSGHVADSDTPTSAREGKEVVIVTADATRWLVEGFRGEVRNREGLRREKGLLDILRTL